MAELLNEQDRVRTIGPRSADEIRQRIAAEKELISETVDKVGVRLRETIDWRSQVRQHPLLAIGAAGSIGLLLSALFKRRSTPAEQIADAISRLADRGDQNQNAIKLALVAIATQLAKDWVQAKALDLMPRHRAAKRPHPTYDSTVEKEAGEREPSSEKEYADDQLLI
jgi:ElaB/YqjD/DUF883 family membrane-anchored ribosome-binding protein